MRKENFDYSTKNDPILIDREDSNKFGVLV